MLEGEQRSRWSRYLISWITVSYNLEDPDLVASFEGSIN